VNRETPFNAHHNIFQVLLIQRKHCNLKAISSLLPFPCCNCNVPLVICVMTVWNNITRGMVFAHAARVAGLGHLIYMYAPPRLRLSFSAGRLSSVTPALTQNNIRRRDKFRKRAMSIGFAHATYLFPFLSVFPLFLLVHGSFFPNFAPTLPKREQKKKRTRARERLSASTMMQNEACEAYKMNAHHVPFRQSVEQIRLGKKV